MAGTATAVSGRVARRQAERFADRDAQIASTRAEGWYEGTQTAARSSAPESYPAGPSPTEGESVATQLRELAQLRDDGILTDEEFAAQKARILAG